MLNLSCCNHHNHQHSNETILQTRVTVFLLWSSCFTPPRVPSSPEARAPTRSPASTTCLPSSTSASWEGLLIQGPFTRARLSGNLPSSSQHLSSGRSRLIKWKEKVAQWHSDFQDAVRSARTESGASVNFQLESPATAERIRQGFTLDFRSFDSDWSYQACLWRPLNPKSSKTTWRGHLPSLGHPSLSIFEVHLPAPRPSYCLYFSHWEGLI